MPIYEYVCDKCGKHFERLLKRGASDDGRCPRCGALGAKKQLSSFSAGSSSSNCNSGG